MADPVFENNVLKFTETSMKELGNPIRTIGARLIAGSGVDATAKVYDGIDNTGTVVASFAAAQKTSDEMAISFNADSGKVYVELSGTGAELYIYVK